MAKAVGSNENTVGDYLEVSPHLKKQIEKIIK
jgi:hypothetical protein